MKSPFEIKTRQWKRTAVIKGLKEIRAEFRLLKGKVDMPKNADKFFELMIIVPCYFNEEKDVIKLKEWVEWLKAKDEIMPLWGEVDFMLSSLGHKSTELDWVIDDNLAGHSENIQNV